MSQDALTGLCEPQAESENSAQTTEDLPEEPCTSNQQEIVGDQCEQAVKNDESSSSPSGKYISWSRSESTMREKLRVSVTLEFI